MRLPKLLVIPAAVAVTMLTASTVPAMATARPAEATVTPDIFGGTGTLTHYSDYMIVPGEPGDGVAVTFHDFGGSTPTDDLWTAVDVGTVTDGPTYWPFADHYLDYVYNNHRVTELEYYNSVGWAVGDSANLDYTVLRPASDGNWWVEVSLGGQNYNLVNVHATGEGNNNPVCLQNQAPDTGGQLTICGSPDETMTWHSTS